MIAREITGTRRLGPLFFGLKPSAKPNKGGPGCRETIKRRVRCAIYTHKSTDEGLDQKYNSIDTQRDAGRAVRREATRITPDHL